MATFDTPYGKIGVAICYDMRFPELAQLYADMGCFMVIYPGAFNTTTGPKHWELLLRARAVDNQFFVVGCSPARNPALDYPTWGHSTVVGPWGDVLETCDEKEASLLVPIDVSLLDDFRTSVPTRLQKRFDVYQGVQRSNL